MNQQMRRWFSDHAPKRDEPRSPALSRSTNASLSLGSNSPNGRTAGGNAERGARSFVARRLEYLPGRTGERGEVAVASRRSVSIKPPIVASEIRGRPVTCDHQMSESIV